MIVTVATGVWIASCCNPLTRVAIICSSCAFSSGQRTISSRKSVWSRPADPRRLGCAQARNRRRAEQDRHFATVLARTVVVDEALAAGDRFVDVEAARNDDEERRNLAFLDQPVVRAQRECRAARAAMTASSASGTSASNGTFRSNAAVIIRVRDRCVRSDDGRRRRLSGSAPTSRYHMRDACRQSGHIVAVIVMKGSRDCGRGANGPAANEADGALS